MYKRPTIYKFITFLLIFTVLFSNNLIEIYAEQETVSNQEVESSTETTTEDNSVVVNYADANKKLDISARAAILIDATTGTVIYEKNAHEKLYPASITKVLTGYIACSEGNLEDTLTVSQNAIDGMGVGGSSIGLVAGEQINFEDGLYGVMLESANEVCMAIAEHMSGTVDAFVDKMNEVAQSIGCTESHFANPHGFHNENHYTTCYDMALITKQAVTNEEFNQIWHTISYQIPPTNLNVARYLNHKDKMIKPGSEYYYPDLIGGKTGFTDEAGNTLVSYAERDGAYLISVVMKADGYDKTYTDTKTLMEYGFSVYNGVETLFDSENYSTTANVIQNYKGKTYTLGTVGVGAARSIDMALPNFISAQSVEIRTNFNKELEAPIKIDDIVGTIDIYYNDILLDSVEAVATTEAPALSNKELAKRELKENVRKYVAVPLIACLVVFILLLLIIFIRSICDKISGKPRKRKKRRRNNKTRNSKRRKGSKKRRKRKRRPDSE